MGNLEVFDSFDGKLYLCDEFLHELTLGGKKISGYGKLKVLVYSLLNIEKLCKPNTPFEERSKFVTDFFGGYFNFNLISEDSKLVEYLMDIEQNWQTKFGDTLAQKFPQLMLN